MASRGLPHTGWTTHQLRPTLDEPRRGWSAALLLAAQPPLVGDHFAGEAAGQSVQCAARVAAQHRKWREARVIAEQEGELVWIAAFAAVEAAEKMLTDAKNANRLRRPTSRLPNTWRTRSATWPRLPTALRSWLSLMTAAQTLKRRPGCSATRLRGTRRWLTGAAYERHFITRDNVLRHV